MGKASRRRSQPLAFRPVATAMTHAVASVIPYMRPGAYADWDIVIPYMQSFAPVTVRVRRRR